MRIKDRLTHAWNAFTGVAQTHNKDIGRASSRSYHKSYNPLSAATFVAPIYNRIALDVATTNFKHVVVNKETGDEDVFPSRLQQCLSVEANIDQTHLQFIQDVVYSMFDEGVVAVVPVETTISPNVSGGYDIISMRTAKITTWYPRHVELEVYNDQTGQNERIIMEKRHVAIIENPLYAIVNDSNSTLKRLLRKLQQMDNIDDINSNKRLDLMISIPYKIKTETQRKMAMDRIREIEEQLTRGNHGIAYIDGTEKMQQLNRPIETQLPETVETLRQELYNQLGLTKNIFDGTATEAEIRVYNSRTIDPIVEHIAAEYNRKFFTKTARTQGHKITYYRDMFKMVPIETLASLGDTLRRNWIASSNELRGIIGFKRSKDPRADELFNPNMADNKQKDPGRMPIVPTEEYSTKKDSSVDDE